MSHQQEIFSELITEKKKKNCKKNSIKHKTLTIS